MPEIMVRYGELSVKGRNKRRFIRQLARNIEVKFDHLTSFHVKAENDFLFVTCKDGDVQNVLDGLGDVFGIQSYGLVHSLPRDFEQLTDYAIQLVAERLATEDIKTFKVATSRADHHYKMDTYAMNRELGAQILTAYPYLKVKMKEPDLTLRLKVREQDFLLSTNFIPGRGGLPVGTSARGVLMLSVGIDSPVAGYLAMKRGIRPICIHFASPPYTSPQALQNAKDLAQVLTRYGSWLSFVAVPFTEIQEEIKAKIPSEYLMTVTRRMMLRVADALRVKVSALAIINGESVGQVASQTIESMQAINAVTSTPIIRPVICMDKLEIIALSEAIGTFNLSIAPYEDCCTIFAPPSPKTKPRLKDVLRLEQRLDIDGLVKRCVEQCEVETLTEIKEALPTAFDDLL